MMLKNKVALITGVGSGMGEAMAKLFAAEGANVVGADINQEAINRVINNIRETDGAAIGVKADVSQPNDIEIMIKSAVKEYGRLDILVNSIVDNFVRLLSYRGALGPYYERKCKRTLLACEALKIMLKQGKGVIINNASVGDYSVPVVVLLMLRQHALIGLTKISVLFTMTRNHWLLLRV